MPDDMTAPVTLVLTDAAGNTQTIRIAAPLPVVPGDGPSESPEGTRVTATSVVREIRDAKLDEWSIMAGQVSHNKAPVKPTWAVAELVYCGGHVYQRNDQGQWYGPCSETSGGVAVPGDPTLPAGSRKHTDIPFASNSVWNIGIGSGAQWSGDNDADTQKLRQLRGGVNAGSWGMPVFFGKASDPVVVITLQDNLYPLAPQRVHVPRGAKPALPAGGPPSSGVTDAHMAFYDETQPGKLWTYWGCVLNNGRDVVDGITAGLGQITDAMGDGITHYSGNNHNCYFAGTITSYDLSQSEIRHMVRVAISPDANKSPGSNWTENIPWPSTHEDWYGYRDYKGPIVAGSTFGIPRSVNLASLGLSPGGMVLAKCLQTYGALWRDQGGTNQISFYSTPENDAHPLIVGMRGDMAKIVPQLRIMRNQAAATPNGGGSYPAPLPAVG